MPCKDLEAKKAYFKKWYKKNKEDVVKRVKKNRALHKKRNKKFVREYLSTQSCIDCGNSDTRVLDFDHVRDKKDRPISKMIDECLSIRRIKQEIDKCEIRCANCHRIRHAEERLLKQVKQESEDL